MMKTKKVKFVFDAQFCGTQEITKDIYENDVYADKLIELFKEIMGIKFDCNCSIHIPEDGILITKEEDLKVSRDDELSPNIIKREKAIILLDNIINELNSLKELLLEE